MSEADDLIDALLGAPRHLTRSQVAEQAGMPLEQARLYWRAMGFADVGDSPAFTDADLRALKQVHSLVETSVLSPEEALEVVRSLGQNTARMATWQTGTIARLLARQGDIPDEDAMSPEHVAKVAQLTGTLVPGLEEMLVYAWRRQLAAALQRSMDTADEDDPDAGYLCIGFADIVGFTRLSRRLPDNRLADLVTTFETDSADVVASTGARMVKTLGDEVMFVSESPAISAQTALLLHDIHHRRDDVPSLRIGLAFGEVVTRMGDVFGSTVNLASRLTDLARPGTTLVDDACAGELLDDHRYNLRVLRPRAIRGLGLVRAWSLQRGR